jgi:hypothetical protein
MLLTITSEISGRLAARQQAALIEPGSMKDCCLEGIL